MFTRYSEGATMQELVNLLNSRGMRSIRDGNVYKAKAGRVGGNQEPA